MRFRNYSQQTRFIFSVLVLFAFISILPVSADFDKASNINQGGAIIIGVKNLNESFTAPWMKVNGSAGWSGRYGHNTVVTSDGSIVLFGGAVLFTGDKNCYRNDTWRSTDNGLTWSQMNTNPGWTARFGSSSIALPDGSILLMGGVEDPYGTYKNDIWRSNDDGTTWSLVNPNAPWPARYLHSSVLTPDGSIILMGGYNGEQFFNDVWRSTDRGVTWNLVNASAGWSARSTSSVALSDGSILIMGGQGKAGTLSNDVWRSTDVGVTWRKVDDDPGWSKRWGQSSIAMPDGSILLMGGADQFSLKNDVWQSYNDGATWSMVTENAEWIPRSIPGVVAINDGSVVLTGGGTYSDGMLNDVWRFMPTDQSGREPLPDNYGITVEKPSHRELSRQERNHK